ncbi:MAG: hypothetical protein OEZ43_01605 [Gammaproteobacteria bacterium]|nr:hypothetical protein [Gammaproteobacteria bacterium]
MAQFHDILHATSAHGCQSSDTGQMMAKVLRKAAGIGADIGTSSV